MGVRSAIIRELSKLVESNEVELLLNDIETDFIQATGRVPVTRRRGRGETGA